MKANADAIGPWFPAPLLLLFMLVALAFTHPWLLHTSPVPQSLSEQQVYAFHTWFSMNPHSPAATTGSQVCVSLPHTWSSAQSSLLVHSNGSHAWSFIVPFSQTTSLHVLSDAQYLSAAQPSFV